MRLVSTHYDNSMDSKKLIVIGQQQRCGGSLMVRLFDGHEQVAVHPHENYFGRPYKYFMPDFDSKLSPMRVWEDIYEPTMVALSMSQQGEGGYPLRYNFHTHKKIFVKEYPANPTYQNICYHYLYSLFKATSDYCNLNTAKYYLYFTPRHALYADDILRVFKGCHVIQVIRNPLGYYNSVKSHNRFCDIYSVKFIWRIFFYNVLRCTKKKLSNYHPIIFEEMLSSPENTLRGLCHDIGIVFNENLLIPTFGGIPWSGNSRFRKLRNIDSSVGKHYKKYLKSEEINYFKKEVYLYELLRENLSNKQNISCWNDEILEGLNIFETYLSMYKKEKPVNTKGYLLKHDSQKLYDLLVGDNSKQRPSLFYQVSDIEETKILVNSNEMLDIYYPRKIHPLRICKDLFKSLDANSSVQFIIGLINIYGSQIPEDLVSKYLNSTNLSKIVDEVIRLYKKDSRGISLSTLLTLCSRILKSDNSPKMKSCCRILIAYAKYHDFRLFESVVYFFKNHSKIF